MCHFQVSSHTAGFHFVIGCWQITGLSLLLPGLNLPWAPVPTASSCCCQVHSVSWVPDRLPLLLSPSPHSAMCHFQVSSHCWCVTFFV
ncbi:unnamed protein product, partial [Staurois parvus]